MEGTVLTVLGPIEPTEVGPTLLHEHLLNVIDKMVPVPTDPELRRLYEQPVTLENLAEIRWSRAGMLSRDNIDQGPLELRVDELKDLRAAGGRTLCEVSVVGLRGDARELPEISRRSGVHIVAGTAFFVEALTPAEYLTWSVEQLSDFLIKEHVHGIGDSGIRAGMLGEVGTGAPLMPFEERSLRASVRAVKATGMGMMVHTDPWHKEGLRVVDVLEEAGADLSRVVIGHLNPSLPDVGYHRAMAERGAVLGYDLCGYDIVLTDGRFPAHDWETADAVAQLVAEGFGDRIILSQDTALKTDYLRYGGWGYGHIFRRVVPLLRERGVSDQAIHQMTVETPARILTLAPEA
ncbi:phosphotriesterase-related protein [soil metagenome]